MQNLSWDASLFLTFSMALNDESGNGNGVMETGEDIMGSLTVENVGIENAANMAIEHLEGLCT